MKVYCLSNLECFKNEAYSRGCRDDIFVLINDTYYKLSIYDKCRLIQDFDTEISQIGYYIPEPNMLIVERVTEQNIIKTILEAFNNGLFDYLKPCKKNDRNELQYILSTEQCEYYKKMNLPYKVNISELIKIFEK